PSTSDEQSPSVIYSSEGVFDASLTVSNNFGEDTETKTEIVQVLSSVGEELPFEEGFESILSIEESDRWFIENEDEDMTWEKYDGIGSSSNSSVWINNFFNEDNNKDRLFSSTIDLGDVDEVLLSMDVAFAQKDEDDKDKLRVYVSTDCGDDWNLKKSFSGHTTLKSVEPMTEEFFPQSADDWHTLEVDNISGSNLVEGFRFYLYFENDGGNNIFVDNINLSFISTGLNDPDLLNLDLQLFPNPTSTESALEYYLLGDRRVSYSITDITGRMLENVDLGVLPFGEQRILLEKGSMASGIYTIELLVDGKSSQVKWMID
ncbi:MAG: T9SS type A sorting domain-containing protein, partial [Flavobacteriales bacterium]|nr:T9SS type A sorting domain-containing protein [Flavobacteriales bacterium]